MACMEHECLSCEYVWHDNRPRGRCPLCCGPARHLFDESPEPEEEDDAERVE